MQGSGEMGRGKRKKGKNMVLEYLVVHYQFDRCACSLLLRRRVHEHFVHILSMEHVVPTRRCLLIFNRPCNNKLVHSYLLKTTEKKNQNQKTHGFPHFCS